MKHIERSRHYQQGFSLIELMIVIAIIGILVSVGIPVYKMIIKSGNETAAIQTLETLRKVQANYSLGHRGEYATFDELVKEGEMDDRYKGDAPNSNGYVFTMKITKKSPGQPSNFTINADPLMADGLGATGKRHFYVDPNISTVRESRDQPAGPSDPAIGQ